MAGAGTVTQAIDHYSTQPRGTGKGGFKVVKLTCIGDSSGGGIPATDTTQAITNQIKGCYLIKVQSIIGAIAPTASSDVTIKDENGVDLLSGNGTDLLSNTPSTSAEAWPMDATQFGQQPIIGALTLTVTNDIVTSATYQIWLYCVAASPGL